MTIRKKMKRIVLFDPSYGTSNMGDYIINESLMSEMSYLFDDSFTVRYSTHNPLLRPLQFLRSNRIIRNCRDADLKFIGGTNILKDNLLKLDPGWNVNLTSSRLYSGAICIGAGRAITRAGGRPNSYTRRVYERALSKDFSHSVRDEKSKVYLESLGFKAINTGCPTTWALTPELAADIPTEKAPNVVLTLTDYARDHDADSLLLSTLIENYESVSCWIQGASDYDYITSFEQSSRIKLIPPSLAAFARELDRDDTEYVGTRLHAGIYALQRRTRSMIISVDNRAEDMASSNGIPVVTRANLRSLPELVNSERVTSFNVDSDAVNEWKSQFVDHV